jgi:hypothetical protein
VRGPGGTASASQPVGEAEQNGVMSFTGTRHTRLTWCGGENPGEVRSQRRGEDIIGGSGFYGGGGNGGDRRCLAMKGKGRGGLMRSLIEESRTRRCSTAALIVEWFSAMAETHGAVASTSLVKPGQEDTGE